MDNLNENKLLQELTPEELENVKGGFQALPNDVVRKFTILFPPTIGIVWPPTIGIVAPDFKKFSK
ncbi:hypothetical protein HUN01_07810 [Nostoc edaphicum CCNP1411]|uniref:Bacteriocin n=1 Tax=Nostoc edaphicum CCNP1411 TaxID=1472755 RepID=A0A7D7LBD5_9NOSO|nr:hypothetical protein [Nostoc edaphicum]QMS87490.1 hypothetical protein HUN01_07810 [Nostoc edaphicum CCNP1411]